MKAIGKPVEAERAREGNNITAVDQASAKSPLCLGELVEVDPGRILEQTGGHLVLGLFDGDAISVIDAFAR